MLRFKRCFTSMIAGTFLFMGICCRALSADRDHDAIDDEVEQMLIDRHSPYLAFDSKNSHWPCSATWFVQHSELKGNGVFIDQPTLEAHPELVLQQNFGGESSSFLCTSAGSGFSLDVVDIFRTGENAYLFSEANRHVGMYAHVFLEPGDNSRIVVQYLQLFPFNDSQFPDLGFDTHIPGIGEVGFTHIGDHEGDWLMLEVYVRNDVSSNYPVERIVWHHHGDRNCPPSVAGSGEQWSIGDVTFDHNGRTPLCYLEEGTHEWWPYAGGEGEACPIHKCFSVDPCFGFLGGCEIEFCFTLPIYEDESHDGESPVKYQTANIPNLGEIWAPMPGTNGTPPLLDNLLVLHFNGTWGNFGGDIEGESPRGPILQGDPSWWRAASPTTLFVPTNVVIECDESLDPGHTGAAVATWGCGGPASISYNDTVEPGPCPESKVISRLWTAKWENGDSMSQEQRITVVDTRPPEIVSITAAHDSLWPPSHKMATVTFDVLARDNCDPKPTSRIVGIESDESVDGLGDGHTTEDWRLIGPLTAALRAERSGRGNGRTYTITIESMDACGNASRAKTTVGVPLSARR